jgi:type II secretory pathway component PulF
MRLPADCAAPPPPFPPPRGGGGKRTWLWSARDRSGQPKRGEKCADDADEVTQHLSSLGYTDIWVRARLLPRLPSFRELLGLVGPAERILVARQLATIVDAGMTPEQCLDLIIGANPNRTVRRQLTEAWNALHAGQALGPALRACRLFANAPELEAVEPAQIPAALHALATRLAAERRLRRAARR